MDENKALEGGLDAAGEPWVTGRPMAAQRVPGIEEAQDATYVDPEPTSWRRAALIGVAVGLGVTAIFAAIVLSADSSGGRKQAAVGVPATASSSSSPTTTTTVAPAASPTTAPAPTEATTPTTAPPAVAAAVASVTPRATSDPAAPVYTDVPLPDGIGSTLTGCAWQPTNGGQHEAAGTVTNGTTTRSWTLTVHWLQNGREIAQQSALIPLTAGQSAPWSLTLAAPTAPADPFSCAVTAA